MIKQILFDCGGVLARLDFQSVMTEVSGNPAFGAILVERLWCNDSPWLDYDKGLIPKEEMPRRLAPLFPEIPLETIQLFMERWPSSMIPLKGMETIVQELHAAGYPCYLLSNFNPQFEELRPHHQNLRELAGEVVSYHINMLKPHREIFDYTAQKLGIDPAETLFIDDTQANIEAAIAAGYQGHLFIGADDLRDQLRKLHIFN